MLLRGLRRRAAFGDLWMLYSSVRWYFCLMLGVFEWLREQDACWVTEIYIKKNWTEILRQYMIVRIHYYTKGIRVALHINMNACDKIAPRPKKTNICCFSLFFHVMMLFVSWWRGELSFLFEYKHIDIINLSSFWLTRNIEK